MSYTLQNYKTDVWNFYAYRRAVERAIAISQENEDDGGLSEVWLRLQEKEIRDREAQLAEKAKELNLAPKEVAEIWRDVGERQNNV